MWSTAITLFFLFILLGVGFWIWDAISDYMTESERRYKENQKAEEVRNRYPPIENWVIHPLYKATIPFLVEKIDYFIQGAKKTKARRDVQFRLKIEVKPERVYITSYTEGFDLYYSSIGYDNIKVGYYKEESNEACNDFAIALSAYLKEYYLNENIDVSDVSYCIPEGDFDSSVKFWIDLSNLMQRLKQV